jgi:outer membrane receptor protein involved in Fe transport
MTRQYQSLLGSVAIAPALLAIAGAACAQDARVFDVPAGPLDAALVQYARQAGLQVFYTNDQVADLRSAGAQGRMTPQAALDQILRGTGLTGTQSRPGVITLRTGMALSDATEVEEVIVTGSLLRGPSDTPSPVTVIRRDDLDRAGRATVADALVALPQNYAGSATPNSALMGTDPMQSNTGFATGVNLRGLGPDSTLVLVNGRRLSGTGSKGDFADASAIPTAVVERVDVLLDGASALYGSDAVGGVVNILLRKDFEGQESRLRIGAARGGAEDLVIAHTLGGRWSSGHALLSWEYQHQGALNAGDRDYSRTGDLRPFGGTDHRTYYSTPGNIVVAGTTGYTTQYAIRPGASGVATRPADFVAGAENLGSSRESYDLLPEQDRQSVYALIGQSIGSAVELSADLRFSQRDFDITATAPITIATVTSANPYFVSPNGSTSHQIAYSFGDEAGNSHLTGSSRSLGVSAGATIHLPADWTADVYAAFASERALNLQTGMLNSLFLSEALGNSADSTATAYSATRDGYLNLFGSGAANNQTVLDFVTSGYTRYVDETEIASINGLVQGSVLSLPGGDLKVALGAQLRTETLSSLGETFLSTATPGFSASPDKERQVTAAFVEARIPIFGAANARPGLQRLELSLAARIEDYDDIGSTTNPKVGVIWAPVSDLKLRANWGTSFRAPALTEIFDRYYITAAYVSDGTTRKVALIQGGGNADLQPETAETFTAGFDWSPSHLSGLRVSGTWFDTTFDNQIGRPAGDNLSQALIDPSLSPFVTLVNPTTSAADRATVVSLISSPAFLLPGILPAEAYGVIVDGRWVNTASVQVRGIDGAVSYDFDVGDRDRFRIEASGSYMSDYRRQVTPTAPVVNRVGQFGYPVEFRGTLAGTWTRGAWSLRVAANHVSSYATPSGSDIDAWNTADVQAIWIPEGPGWSEGLQLTLSVRNVFDLDPPFYDATSGLGFDAGQSDPLGRVASLQLTKRW